MPGKKDIPNIITALRIVGTLCLLFIRPLSPAFYVVYTLAGITDVLDGYLARRMNASSEFGARLDSVADLLFYTLSLIRILPVLWERLPHHIWIAVGLILFLRVCSYLVAALRFRRFASHHSWMNKATGFLVFAIPYFILTSVAGPYCWLTCGFGGVSTVEELYSHIFSKRYDLRQMK